MGASHKYRPARIRANQDLHEGREPGTASKAIVSPVIAMTEKHQNCACERCVAARRSMLLRTHPIHARRDEDVAPTLIPVDQALAMALEERDDLRMRLARVDSDIKVLRDCSQGGIT